MKLSDNWVIRFINGFAAVLLTIFVIYFFVTIISGIFPSIKGIYKGYEIYNVNLENAGKTTERLTSRHQAGGVISVQEPTKATVVLKLSDDSQLFSFSGIVFQLLKISYLLLTGLLILKFKIFFGSLAKDDVFTIKNASLLITCGLILIFMPILDWLNQESLIWCIESLKLNESGYILTNGAKAFTGRTTIGLILFAIGFAFRVGVNLKQENEAFV